LKCKGEGARSELQSETQIICINLLSLSLISHILLHAKVKENCLFEKQNQESNIFNFRPVIQSGLKIISKNKCL